MIGKHIKSPVESRSVEEAVETVGLFGRVRFMGNPRSSEQTRMEIEKYSMHFPCRGKSWNFVLSF